CKHLFLRDGALHTGREYRAATAGAGRRNGQRMGICADPIIAAGPSHGRLRRALETTIPHLDTAPTHPYSLALPHGTTDRRESARPGHRHPALVIATGGM